MMMVVLYDNSRRMKMMMMMMMMMMMRMRMMRMRMRMRMRKIMVMLIISEMITTVGNRGMLILSKFLQYVKINQ